MRSATSSLPRYLLFRRPSLECSQNTGRTPDEFMILWAQRDGSSLKQTLWLRAFYSKHSVNGITNIELRTLDLTEFPKDAGTFDYIIAHGVYSWVPPNVRAHVLTIVQQHLAPNGVA